jgi:hypothetical protein
MGFPLFRHFVKHLTQKLFNQAPKAWAGHLSTTGVLSHDPDIRKDQLMLSDNIIGKSAILVVKVLGLKT